MKLGITCTSQPMQPNARYVSSFRNSETAVTASDRSIENLVIVKYEGSCLAKQMLLAQRDLKVVTTLHGTDITLVGQDPSYFTITKFSIERSDAVTAVSEFLKEETYRAFGCVGCDVQVIPNFISPADFFPATDGTCRRALAPADHKILIHVSNFRPVKRLPGGV